MGTYQTLQYGSQGYDVKDLQRRLAQVGYGVGVDGIFGVETQAAIKRYQENNGLAVDGIVGDETWGSLNGNTHIVSKGNVNKTNTNTATTNNKTSGFTYDDFKYDAYKESDLVNEAKNALDTQLAQKPGAYQSQWQTQLNDTINKILNREKFSYDLNGDALYQQYKDKYTQQAKMSSANVMGQAAAMTGGYGNSYAQSVGNQAYQAEMQNLNDIIPELYQMAYDKYNQEGQDLYNQYSMLGTQEEQDYGRYRDTVADWNTERDYLTGRYDTERDYDYTKYNNERDFAYGQYSDDRNLAYTDHRNTIADEQWQQEFNEAKRQFDANLAEQRSQFNAEHKAKYPSVSQVDAPDDDEPVNEEDLFADFDGVDWEAYFAEIRNSDGKSAAEAEMSRLSKAGILPDNMTYYASIGARGSLGH